MITKFSSLFVFLACYAMIMPFMLVYSVLWVLSEFTQMVIELLIRYPDRLIGWLERR